MDKKLILGVMDKHVELVEERRAAVLQSHLTQQPNASSDNESASEMPSGQNLVSNI